LKSSGQKRFSPALEALEGHISGSNNDWSL